MITEKEIVKVEWRLLKMSERKKYKKEYREKNKNTQNTLNTHQSRIIPLL